MSTTTSQRTIFIPQSGADGYQGAKGQSHHSMFAQAVARNTNYALQHRTTTALIGINGHSLDYGEGVTPAPTSVFSASSVELLQNRGISIVWEPHASNLTIGYAIRASKASSPAGTINLYLCDKAWKGTVVPSDAQYTLETITVVAGSSYAAGGTGTANGEFTGTVTATFPRPPDGLYYVYAKMQNVDKIGHFGVWVSSGTP